jgi:hypothetical protein
MPDKNWKVQTRLLVREGAPHQQTRNWLKNYQRENGKNWSRVPNGCLTPRRTGRLTVSRNIILTLTLTFSVRHSYRVVQITCVLDKAQSDVQKAFHRIISRHSVHCWRSDGASDAIRTISRHKHFVCMPFSPVRSHSSAPFTSLIIHRITEANKNCRSELVPFPVAAVRAVISSLWNWRSTYAVCKLQVIMNVCQHILNSLYNFYRAPSLNMGHAVA